MRKWNPRKPGTTAGSENGLDLPGGPSLGSPAAGLDGPDLGVESTSLVCVREVERISVPLGRKFGDEFCSHKQLSAPAIGGVVLKTGRRVCAESCAESLRIESRRFCPHP